jgi:hypothetical protein
VEIRVENGLEDENMQMEEGKEEREEKGKTLYTVNFMEFVEF